LSCKKKIIDDHHCPMDCSEEGGAEPQPGCSTLIGDAWKQKPDFWRDVQIQRGGWGLSLEEYAQHL